MTYALVDNATLTAVQRILGQAPYRSADAVDADLAALENLIVALLLYDELVAIDDYKQQFREARRAAFPFVRFLDPNEYGLPSVAAAADDEGTRVLPVIRGGEFEQDFRVLLDELKVHTLCSWNMTGSVFHLVMGMLGRPETPEFAKYSKISATIYNELQDQRLAGGKFDPSALLVAADGTIINDGYVLEGLSTDQMGQMSWPLATFLASLRWLAQRTIYYAMAAEHLRGDAVLSPIRQAYHRQYMQRTARFDGTAVAEVISLFNDRAGRSVDAIIRANRPSHVRLALPLFSAWLVQQTDDVRRILDVAVQVRDDPTVAKARAQLKEIRLLHDAGQTVDASRKVLQRTRELDAALVVVQTKFGLPAKTGVSLATVIKVFNSLSGARIPEIGEQVRVPVGLTSWRPQGIGALYRNINDDLADFPKLGRLREQLGAAVIVDDTKPIATPRAEDPKFRYAKPGWKRPM